MSSGHLEENLAALERPGFDFGPVLAHVQNGKVETVDCGVRSCGRRDGTAGGIDPRAGS
jgi:hypothetical protein